MAYNKNEIADALRPYLGMYGNPKLGPSYVDSFRNANAGLAHLNTLNNAGLIADNNYYDTMSSVLKNQKISSAIGGSLAGLNGINMLAGQYKQASSTADLIPQYGQLEDISRFGNYNYGNYQQLASDMSNMPTAPDVSFDDIRGMSNAQALGSIGTSALTGLKSGFEVGGGVGALIGGIAGFGSGIAGVIRGDRDARNKLHDYQARAAIATNSAQMNFAAAHDRIGERNNRLGVVNSAASGGRVERKMESITSFAQRKTNPPLRRERKQSSGITSTHVEGGTRIRIKR